ncbi:MAG: hypothetical protein WAO00_19960, partial [Chthoniobacterales bacterium]
MPNSVFVLEDLRPIGEIRIECLSEGRDVLWVHTLEPDLPRCRSSARSQTEHPVPVFGDGE